jgi:SH3-like domain-containing protein
MHRSRFLAVLTLLTLLCASIPTASATPVQDNTAGSWTDAFHATSGSLSTSSHAAINTASGAVALTKSNGSGLFNVPYYASGSVMSVTISPLIFGHWNQLSFSVTNTGSTAVKIQVYKSDGATLVSDTDLPGNSAGFTTSPVDLSTIPYGSTIGLIKLKATLTTSNTNYTPRLNSWTLTWVTRNGQSNNPAPSTGPWSALAHDNRATNQMDGTLSSAYTPMWANTQVNVPRTVLTNSGDVVVTNNRAATTDPYRVIVLDKATGLTKTSFTMDAVPTTAGSLKQTAPYPQAVAKDNTIYLSRGPDNGDDGNFTSLLAVRDGQLLWSRYVNQYSGYSQWLTLDNSGSILIRSGHGNTSKITATGSKLWEVGPNYWNWAGPLSIGPNNTVYAKGSDGGFTARSTTGANLYSTGSVWGPGTAIVDTDNTVYWPAAGGSCSGSGYLIRINSAGVIVWQKSFYGGIAPDQPGMAMDQNHIYVKAGCKDALYVVNKSDGSIAATIGSNTALSSNSYRGRIVVDHAQQLLFDSNTANSLLLDGSNGGRLWSYSTPASTLNPFGSSSQSYASWGTGTLAFKPWTLATTANGTSTIAGAPMTVTATSSMLQADPVTSEANKIQAVMQDGQKVSLAYVSTDSGGTTHWSGQYTPSASDPGGIYTATIEASNARVQTGTGTSFATPAAGTNNTGIKLTFGYTVQAITSTVISSSQSTNAQTLILTATVSPATAAGTISFYDGSVNLGSAAIANGTASFDLPAFPLSVGTHSFTASYGGSSVYAPSTSSAISPTITLTSGTTATGGGGGGGGGSRTPLPSSAVPPAIAATAPAPVTSSAQSSSSVLPDHSPPPAAAPSSAVSPSTRLTTVNVFMRAKPTKQSASLALLPPGSPVTLISKTPDWAQVRTPDGTTGFILRKYLQTVPSSQPAPSPVAPSSQSRTTTMPLNLRAATTKQSKVIAQIPANVPVTLVQVLKDWAKVQTGDGKTGYVLRKYLRK